MKFALIKNKICVNIIEAENKTIMPDLVDIKTGFGIGDTYDNGWNKKIETPVEKKNKIIDETKRKRMSGTEINGIFIDTDTQTRGALALAHIQIKKDITITYDWQMSNKEWVEINNTNIDNIIDGVDLYIRNNFTEEKQRLASVEKG